jgi:hypothetical protein
MEIYPHRGDLILPTDELPHHHHRLNDVSVALELRLNGKGQLNLVPRLNNHLQLLRHNKTQHFIALNLKRAVAESHFDRIGCWICKGHTLLCMLGLNQS